jgi:phosphoserine phosphatase RsbU/P
VPRHAGPEERRQDRVLGVLALCAVLLGVLAVLVDPGQPPVILLVWVPVAGAALLEPRRVAALAAATFVVGLAVILAADMFDTNGRVFRCLALAGAGGGAVWLASLRTSREERLRRMTHVAHVAQRAVIRAVPPHLGNVDLAARYISATEEALIGGDLFEVALSPYGVRMVVGDVRGKGLPAVEVASTVLSTFRVSAFQEPHLTGLAARLDEAVRREIERTGDEEDFVTAVLVEIREGGGSTVVSCGHHPPLLLGESPRPLRVQENPPLGLGPAEHHARARWTPGTRLLLYTDGLVEARDAEGRFFPLDAHVGELGEGDLETALDALVQRLMEHAGGRLADDLALLLVECRPTPPPVPAQDREHGMSR